MTERAKLLIADPDPETVDQLQKGLEADYDLVFAEDGSKALELSILESPDLILFYRQCPLIGAAHFLKIIRTNPRTEEIPLVVLSDHELHATAPPGFMQGVMVKPLNVFEVKTQIKSVLQKVATAKKVGSDSRAIKGSLEQIAMVDLLQIFSMNRQTGALEVTPDTDPDLRAVVYVHDAKIEGAECGQSRGLKALFRILSWHKGSFSFVGGNRSDDPTLSGPIDALLMEGMRQADEYARVRQELPPEDAVLERRIPEHGVPEGLHPVTAKILAAVPQASRIAQLFDAVGATDLDVALGLRSLLQAGLVEIVGSDTATDRTSVLSQDEVYDLNDRMRLAGVPPEFVQRIRIGVMSPDGERMSRFMDMCAQLPGYEPHASSSGTISLAGSLKLDGQTTVEFVLLEGTDAMVPMATAMTAGASALVMLGTETDKLSPAIQDMMVDKRRAIKIHLRFKGESRRPSEAGSWVFDVDDLDEDAVRTSLQRMLKLVPHKEVRQARL